MKMEFILFLVPCLVMIRTFLIRQSETSLISTVYGYLVGAFLPQPSNVLKQGNGIPELHGLV